MPRERRAPISTVSESQVLKRDALFQLQRVVTHDGRRSLVKFAISDLPSAEDALLEHEFQTFRALASEHVLAPIQLDARDRLSAQYEDVEGSPLASMVGLSSELPSMARLVSHLCAALAAFHDRGWIVAGLSPQSFLRDSRTERVVLTDAPFAQSITSPFESRQEHLLRTGYLTYAAPEILSRGHIAADARADLYSLGAVLYELVCGRAPFETTDGAELVHSHLAKEPPPLLTREPSLPRGVADIIMRLLSKDPFDRFDSVAVFEDAFMRATGIKLEPPYVRGRPPLRSGPVSVPTLGTKLYGLDVAESALREKWSRTRSTPEVTFIEGDAGVGKTSLLAHMRGLLTHGYYCRGSFRLASPAAPLSGWAYALRDLANVLLTSSAADVEQWRQTILQELGDGAALIGNLVPEWAAILGTAPREEDAIVDGALNRLAVSIHLLIRCFARPDRPVVLALDDVQWADDSSLRILELVLELPEPVNLLVLCAVRKAPDTTSTSPKVAALRGSLEASRVVVDVLSLGAWGRDQILAFLRGTFGAKLSKEEDVADFLLVRTGGNPLFVREFFRAAIRQRLLTFESMSGEWSYSPEALHTLPPDASVVQFLTRKVLGLPAELKATLQIAACLGPSFVLSDFATIVGTTLDVAARKLERAVVEGLVLYGTEPSTPPREGAAAVDRSFEFAHDRVLEACRGTLTEDERAALCLRIGRTLLTAHSQDPSDDVAHRLAGYFNAARTLITADEERRATAHLNLRAGTFAKRSGAFSQALELLQAGMSLLESAETEQTARAHDGAWKDHPDLTLSLFEAAAEAALLNGQLELMNRLCNEILAHTRSPLKKARTYEIRISGYNAEKRYPEAVTAACDILDEVGVRFPRRPWLAHTVVAYLATKRRIFAGPVERLNRLRTNKDPTVKAAFRIMQTMYSSAYFGQPDLFPLLVCRHIDASLEYGNEDYSCVTYIAFAIVLCARSDFAGAVALGAVALDLLEHPGAEIHTAKVFLGQYAFVFPWTHHLRDSLPFLSEALKAGLQHGDFEYAAHLVTTHSLARFHSGSLLAELAPEFEQQWAKCASLRQERSIILLRLFCQLVHDLRDDSVDSVPLSGPFYAENEMLSRCLDPLDENLAFHHFMAKMILSLFRGDKAGALVHACRAREFFDGGAFGIYVGAVFTFWESLLWAWSARSGGHGRAGAMRRALKGSRDLKRWADAGPMNFLHKYHLVEAELSRASGRPDRAASHYERAIELSQAHGYLQDAALAHECAAEFYLERGMERLARQYLRECHATYQYWGAACATRRLERQYPQHFAAFASRVDGREHVVRATFSESLDYSALLRSSQAISGETQLPNVLTRLLQTMFEHAGAQRAILILERRGHLRVVAEADVDEGGVAFVREELVDESSRVCRSVVRYAATMAKPVVLADATTDERFEGDAYVQHRRPRSVVCIPMVHQGKLLGLAYLENNRVSHVFTAARVEVASLLAAQAAISLAGERLHALELEAHQAKINPHFLFNALSSIADLAVEDGPRAEDAILKLARLYRYILATTQRTAVTIGQEIEIVRNYLVLEKLRFGSKLDFVITCDDRVNDVRIPGLLVQPLVENAIRHGIAPKLTPGCVWVHATQVADRCHIVVQDDGDGSSHATGGTGYGLRSVQERLELVFGRDYGIAITRRGGYRVELEVPLLAAVDSASSLAFDALPLT